MQRIKDVEKLFLRFFLATEELNIIHDEHINGAVEGGKFTCTVISNRLNKLVGEGL